LYILGDTLKTEGPGETLLVLLLAHLRVKSLHALQVWYQQDIVPLHSDILGDTRKTEGQGKSFWHWHVRGIEHMNRYLEQIMYTGNSMGKRLRKKLDGDPTKAFFGGVMVSRALLLSNSSA